MYDYNRVLSNEYYQPMVDQLLIKQKVEILEAVTGFETANKYEVLNSMGQNVERINNMTDIIIIS